MTSASPPSPARWPAALLIAATLVSLFAMAHHPTLGGGDPADVIERAVRTGPMSRIVHGVLIGLMLLQLLLLAELSQRRGTEARFDRAGVLLWTIGTLLLTGAALVSGFIAPALATHAVPGERIAPELAVQFLLVLYLVNQALATAGTLVLAGGMAAWSWPLAKGRGAGRAVGVGGLLAAAIIALALLAGLLRLDVHGMLLALALLGAWMLGVGVVGWRQREVH